MASRKAFLDRNLEDVDVTGKSNNDSLVWKSGDGKWKAVSISGGGGGVIDFTDLGDVPSSYATFSGYYVRVSDDENSLIFDTVVAGAGAFLDLLDTPADFTTFSGAFVLVNPTEDALEFSHIVDYIDFNIAYGDGEHPEGRLHWDTISQTLELGMPGGDVRLQIGQEMHIRVKNESGGNITNGQPVYVDGGTGTFPTIALARADNVATAAVALATEDIDDGQFGYVTTAGLVRDIDTDSLVAAGTLVWLSDTPGELQAFPAGGASRNNVIGMVVRKHASDGIIFVTSYIFNYIDELSGVTILNPIEDDVLSWNAASGIWINKQVSGGAGVDTFLELTDVPNDYSGQAGKHPLVNVAEDALEFVTISGGAWVFEESLSTFGIDQNRNTGGSFAYQAQTVWITRPILLTSVLWDIRIADNYTLTVRDADETILATKYVASVGAASEDFEFALDDDLLLDPGYYRFRMTPDSAQLWSDKSGDVNYYFNTFSIVYAVDYGGSDYTAYRAPLKLKYYDSHTVAGAGGDHGILSGLEDDDHEQYLLADGTRICSGDFTVGDGTGSSYIYIDGAAEAWRVLAFQTGGVNRWLLRVNNTAEGGSNAGSDIELTARKDDGTWLSNPIKVWRATGNVEFATGGLSVGLTPPYTQPRGHLFVHDGSGDDYGFIEAEGILLWSSNAYFDGSIWRTIQTGKSSSLYISYYSGLLYRADNTSRTAGTEATLINLFSVDMVGNAYTAGGLYVGTSEYVTTAGRIKATEHVMIGGGIAVGKVDGATYTGHISFYNGSTVMGEIGWDNTTWLKINHVTAKGIYSPQHMRIDGGISATSSISDAGGGVIAAQRLDIRETGTAMGSWDASDTIWSRLNQSITKNIYSPQYIYSAAGLRAGSAAPAPAGGDLTFADRIKKDHGGTDYSGNIFVPLTAKITGTSWWGTAKSSGGTTITVSTTFPGIPSNVRAISIRVMCRDSVIHPSTTPYLQVGPDSGNADHVSAHSGGDNVIGESAGICTVTSNTIYAYRVASGTNTLDCYLAVNGYFI